MDFNLLTSGKDYDFKVTAVSGGFVAATAVEITDQTVGRKAEDVEDDEDDNDGFVPMPSPPFPKK